MMTTAIRQRVTIQPGGKVELQSNDLPPGSEAEVIVLVEAPPVPNALSPLEAFEELQRSLRLTPEAAQRWIDDARAEREAWGARRDRH